MGFLGHFAHSGGIDPAVVKIEQAADVDGIVDGFIGPAGVVHPGNVRGPDGDRVAVYFLDKPEQGLFRVRDGRSGVVGDDRIDLGAVFQQFRRNCGVALDSKRTLIARRSECGNQFPLSGG